MWYRYRPCQCIDGKGFRSRFSGVRDYRLSLSYQQPGCRHAVTASPINSFQTQFLIIIKLSNLGQETSATLPSHVWSSYSMSCLKQPTTNCAVEIRETSWRAALFVVVVSSLMTSQRRILPPERVVCFSTQKHNYKNILKRKNSIFFWTQFIRTESSISNYQ